MNLVVAFVLFFLLTPQLFFKFKGNKFVVAAVHALVFVAILYLVPSLEGMKVHPDTIFKDGCKRGTEQDRQKNDKNACGIYDNNGTNAPCMTYDKSVSPYTCSK